MTGSPQRGPAGIVAGDPDQQINVTGPQQMQESSLRMAMELRSSMPSSSRGLLRDHHRDVFLDQLGGWGGAVEGCQGLRDLRVLVELVEEWAERGPVGEADRGDDVRAGGRGKHRA